MNDVVNSATRSRMMSGIRGGNTKPELQVRSLLHKGGFRFRVHRKDLPGSPDIVLPKYRAVVFVNGCFWHRHECALFKWPQSNREFWAKKINGNALRDKRDIGALRDAGWRVLTIWECMLKGASAVEIERIGKQAPTWIKSASHLREIPRAVQR